MILLPRVLLLTLVCISELLVCMCIWAKLEICYESGLMKPKKRCTINFMRMRSESVWIMPVDDTTSSWDMYQNRFSND